MSGVLLFVAYSCVVARSNTSQTLSPFISPFTISVSVCTASPLTSTVTSVPVPWNFFVGSTDKVVEPETLSKLLMFAQVKTSVKIKEFS